MAWKDKKMKSVLSGRLRERRVIWNVLVKDRRVGGSIKQGHGDAGQAWTSMQRGGWHRKGRWEKSMPCIRKWIVRNMQTAETKLRKKAKKTEKRLVGRCLQSQVKKGVSTCWRRGALWWASEEVMEEGHERPVLSPLQGCALCWGAWSQGSSLHVGHSGDAPFTVPLCCQAQCWIVWNH